MPHSFRSILGALALALAAQAGTVSLSCAGGIKERSGERVLKGGEAWKALLGNTISGTTPDGPYVDFFAHDGTVVHSDRDGTARGHWTLQEPSICFRFPDDLDDDDCRVPQVQGSRGAFVDRDGSTYRFEIRPGNPEHL